MRLVLGQQTLEAEQQRELAPPFDRRLRGARVEFGQSGVEGPSIFPRTSIGLRVAFKPTSETVLRVALLDGVPLVRPDGSRAAFRGGDGLLAVAEFAQENGGTLPPTGILWPSLGISAAPTFNDDVTGLVVSGTVAGDIVETVGGVVGASWLNSTVTFHPVVSSTTVDWLVTCSYKDPAGNGLKVFGPTSTC